jgi:hypothetical protein
MPRSIVMSIPGLVAFLLILCSVPASAVAMSADDFEKYTGDGTSFSVMVPKGWEKKEEEHPYGDLTKISGIRLTGPGNKEGAAVGLSVLYYSGEGIFPTHEEFIRNRLNSMVRVDRDTPAAVIEVALAGRAGKKFRIKTFELVNLPMRDGPPRSEGRVYEIVPHQRQVTMIQQFIVIPAKKGFHVLNYVAPEDIVGEYQDAFEKAAGSFEPLR